MDPFESIKQTFFQECEELLGALEQKLQALDEGSTDSEDVNAAFRAIHSIKGGAGAFGCTELVGFAHVFEAALDHLRSGRVALIRNNTSATVSGATQAGSVSTG